MTRGRLLLAAVCLLAAACGTAGGGGPKPVAAAAPEAERPAVTTAAAPEADPPPASAAAAEESYSNTIKWKTASELNNFGYNIFRGESPEGPFLRISPEVIEGAGTTDEPTEYRYVDRTIDPRKTYYYYVVSISMDGVQERFTPIGKAEPKLRGAADTESADPDRRGSG